MHSAQVDFTSGFRSLSAVVRGDREPARTIFGATEAFDEWCARWLQRQTVTSLDSEAIAASLDHANPVYIPRNHLVEHALAAATDGDRSDERRVGKQCGSTVRYRGSPYN